MIRRLDLREDDSADYRGSLPRAEFDVAHAVEVCRPICEAVRDRGLAADAEFSEKFDGVTQTDIAVPARALADALEALDPAVRAALEESIDLLRTTCEAERERDVSTS